MKDRNNLEQQLADKLGNRSIDPTGQAWDRIARNREQGKDKKKRKRSYIYYVASIAVVMFLGGYFFTKNTNEIETQLPVVASDRVEKAEKTDEHFIATEPASASQYAERVKVYNPSRQNAHVGIVNTPKEEVKVIAESYRNLQVNENLPPTSVAVLPEVKNITRDKLYDQEIDYLLKNAFKEVAADKQLSKPTDNTALLKEVEAEMDEYYRDKAMSIFSLRHKKIRIAVRE